MTAINQKEYLKKYLSIGSKEGKKKKRKKKAAVGDRVNIIDDDVDISNLTSLEEAADLFNTNEDAPQVVGVIDERPMHLRIADYHNDSWKPLGAQDDENSKQSNANRQGQEENESNSGHKFNMSLSTSLQKGRAESPVRQRNRRDDGSSSSQRYSDNSPPRKGKNRYTRNDDESPQRGHKKDIDYGYSPSRNKNSDNSSPRIKDTDNSPPCITRRNFDSSPRRKSRWDSADSSPIRKNKEGKNTPQHQERKNSDSSPSRRRDTDNSPPRRNRKEPDNSPPHGEKRNRNNSDSSPPRKRGTKRYTDSTPPRQNDGSRRNDNSPPRPRRRRDSDNSPPRKSHPREETDNSPPRRSRRDDDNSPPRRNRRDSDNTPPRKPKRELESPPRPSSSKTVQEPPQRKLLPGDKKGKYLIPAKRSTDFNAQKMTKTLEGKSAGLQNKEELVKENEAFRKREDELFKNMSSDVSGANAAPVLRDRKTGKIRDLQKEAEERKEKEKREEENKEKYSRWGRGLKQVEAYEDKLTQDLHEMNKPLARYADDEDLEKFLKEQEREGDPMLAYIRKKKKKKVVESGKPLKPQYEGEFNPNRFGIVPGYRWDGVDRSNGYEKKWFQVQNSKRAQQEEIYKWSTEDM